MSYSASLDTKRLLSSFESFGHLGGSLSSLSSFLNEFNLNEGSTRSWECVQKPKQESKTGNENPKTGTYPYTNILKARGHPSVTSNTTSPPAGSNKKPSTAPPKLLVDSKTSKKNKNKPRKYVPVNKINDKDILSERGGKSNHHPGNKHWRQIVLDAKSDYRLLNAKTEKTQVSRNIVARVLASGGRFLKKDPRTGKYFVMTENEARRRTSQALRETKELKWLPGAKKV